MEEKKFDVQSVGINRSLEDVFDFIAKPENLPLWTKAFTKADNKSATMLTPNGELHIQLDTIISKEFGTIDWLMKMPDGNIGKAYSRVSENGNTTVYSFVLLAPPVPLEELEGTLSTQKLLLAAELESLKKILET